MPTPIPRQGPLKDIKVVEMGQLIAGPFCGQLLGDMGAEIVKIEPPVVGDPMRAWGRGDDRLWWEVIGRNKRSVSLNLREAEGQDIARRLIAQADILIENFKPGTLERWNMSPAQLHAENPGLIIVRVTGYGQTGPYSGRAGFGGIGEAMGGWRYINGDADRPPSRMGVSIGDSLAATYGCMGALAALHHRDRTGEGQVIDASLYESVLQVMESLVPEYTVSNYTRQRSGSILPGIAPSNVYRCSDGEFLIGANHDGIFGRLCHAMGQPDLAKDARYATHAARGAHQAELDAIIDAWTQTLTVAEVEKLMVANSIPAGRMFRAEDMVADPHFAARESLVEVPHDRYGSITMQNVTPKLSKTPGAVHHAAPTSVGSDNGLLAERLGLDTAQLADLAARGII